MDLAPEGQAGVSYIPVTQTSTCPLKLSLAPPGLQDKSSGSHWNNSTHSSQAPPKPKIENHLARKQPTRTCHCFFSFHPEPHFFS